MVTAPGVSEIFESIKDSGTDKFWLKCLTEKDLGPSPKDRNEMKVSQKPPGENFSSVSK